MEETLVIEFDHNDVLIALEDLYFKNKGRKIDISFDKNEKEKMESLPYNYRSFKVKVKVWVDDRPQLEEIKGDLMNDLLGGDMEASPNYITTKSNITYTNQTGQKQSIIIP